MSFLKWYVKSTQKVCKNLQHPCFWVSIIGHMQLLYILKQNCFTLFPKTMGTCLSNRYLSTTAPSVTYSIIWTISRSFTYFPHSRSLLSILAFSLAPVQKEACVTDSHIPLAASYLQQHFLRQSSQILGCGVIWSGRTNHLILKSSQALFCSYLRDFTCRIFPCTGMLHSGLLTPYTEDSSHLTQEDKIPCLSSSS